LVCACRFPAKFEDVSYANQSGKDFAMKLKIIFAALCVLSVWQTEAQTYDTNNVVVQTFAGSGFSGYVDGVGQQTMFYDPNAIVADSHSNLFVWDQLNYRIRKIAPDSTVTTFAGGGNQSSGVGTNVQFIISGGYQAGMTIDRNDTIWMVCYSSPSLYKVTSGATVTDTILPFAYPWGICADSVGNIYISDNSGCKIYRYSTNGVLSVFAGSGNRGHVDGNGIFTSFNSPESLCADQANNIYVWDAVNYVIRKIDQSQNVTTLAGKPGNVASDGFGTNACFYPLNGMCADNSGNIYLACGYSIRKMDANTNVVTMAGNFTPGYVNGAGNISQFNWAIGVCLAGGSIYIVDSYNQRIRQISFNPTAQVVTGANLGIGTFAGVTITGTVGRTYQVQSSPDMTSWTTRATLLLTSSPFLWIDQNPVSGNKFYRAVMLP
jgi:hypothetical protein